MAAQEFMDSVDNINSSSIADIGRRLLSMEHGEVQGGKHERARRKLATWDENSVTFFNDVKALQRILLVSELPLCQIHPTRHKFTLNEQAVNGI